MISDINDLNIQDLLDEDKKEKTFYACGDTYTMKDDFQSWGWHWNAGLKRWEYEGFEGDEEVKAFSCLDYEATGVWINTDE